MWSSIMNVKFRRCIRLEEVALGIVDHTACLLESATFKSLMGLKRSCIHICVRAQYVLIPKRDSVDEEK
jgi:hypothetical protein